MPSWGKKTWCPPRSSIHIFPFSLFWAFKTLFHNRSSISRGTPMWRYGEHSGTTSLPHSHSISPIKTAREKVRCRCGSCQTETCDYFKRCFSAIPTCKGEPSVYMYEGQVPTRQRQLTFHHAICDSCRHSWQCPDNFCTENLRITQHEQSSVWKGVNIETMRQPQRFCVCWTGTCITRPRWRICCATPQKENGVKMGNYPSDFEIETSRAALGVGSKQPFLRMKNLFCSAAVEYEVMGQSVKSFSTSQSLFVCYVLSNMQNWCPSGVLSFVFSICCMDAIQKKQL